MRKISVRGAITIEKTGPDLGLAWLGQTWLFWIAQLDIVTLVAAMVDLEMATLAVAVEATSSLSQY